MSSEVLKVDVGYGFARKDSNWYKFYIPGLRMPKLSLGAFTSREAAERELKYCQQKLEKTS